MKKPKSFSKPVYIAQPILPNRYALDSKIVEIQKTRQLTNRGPQVLRLEQALHQHFGRSYTSVCANGTLALQLALQALNLTGEVVTTPFTFPATTHTIIHNGLTPIFCDVDLSYNLNPDLLESLITEKTSAILPVHLFGNPCNTDAIQTIADKYNLKIIYDAAHCFGVKINNIPIGAFGDITMFSFHATKCFHTVEGGGLACRSRSLKSRIDILANFGFEEEDPQDIYSVGTNAKMSELHAAVGLLLLKRFEKDRLKRRKLFKIYQDRLSQIPGLTLTIPTSNVLSNYAHCVIRVSPNRFCVERDALHMKLLSFNVHAKKYFSPSVNQLSCYKHLNQTCPNAEIYAQNLLSLPLHSKLKTKDIHHICDILNYIQNDDR